MVGPIEIDVATTRYTRAFEQVCDNIRQQMAAGTLNPGDKLPTEREMAESFQVGRNAVREALRTLEMAGVLRLEKGRAGGAYICPVHAGRVTVVISDLLNFGSIGLDEIAESRTLMMDMVTRLVCDRMTVSDLAALRAIVDEIEGFTQSGDLFRRAAGIAHFYDRLGSITGNRVLVMMTNSLSEIVRRFLDSASLRGRPLESLVPSFRRYIALLEQRDAANACAELRSHLVSTHKHIQHAVERAAGLASTASQARAPAPVAKVARRRKTG